MNLVGAGKITRIIVNNSSSVTMFFFSNSLGIFGLFMKLIDEKQKLMFDEILSIIGRFMFLFDFFAFVM